MPEPRPPANPLSSGTSTAFVGNADFHRCLCDLLDGAQHEVVDFVIPEQRPDEHDKHILRAYGNAVRRGVHCRNLIAPHHLQLVQSTWDPNFRMSTFLERTPHIRLIERVSGPFTVVDRRKVLLNLADARDPAEYTTSVVVEDPALAEHLIARFDELWTEAEHAQAGLIANWEREHEAA
jgi:phosphatidylserine/phosphatidylglycerophosphate/cardiolipin synthase-like enzyme